MSNSVIECSKNQSVQDNGNSDWVNQIAEPFTLNDGDIVTVRNCFINNGLDTVDSIEIPEDLTISFTVGYYDINYTNDTGDKSEAPADVDFDYYVPYILNSTATATLNSITVRGYEGQPFEAAIMYTDKAGKSYYYDYGAYPYPPSWGTPKNININFPGEPGSQHHVNMQLTFPGANQNIVRSSLKIDISESVKINTGESVVGVDWGGSSIGDNALATGYFSALINKGEYDRTNLATTITDKLQYALPSFGAPLLDANNDFLRRSDNYKGHYGFNDIDPVVNLNQVVMEDTFTNIDDFITKTNINFGTAVTVKAYVTLAGGAENMFQSYPCVVDVQGNNGITIAGGTVTLTMTANIWQAGDKVEDGYVEVDITGMAYYPFQDKGLIAGGDENSVIMMSPYPDGASFSGYTKINVGSAYPVIATITVPGNPPTVATLNGTVQAINVVANVVTITFNANIFTIGDTVINGSIQSDSPRGLNFIQIEKDLTDPATNIYTYNNPYYYGASQVALEYDEDREIFKWAFLHMPYGWGAVPDQKQGIAIYKGDNTTAPTTKGNYYWVTQRSGCFFLDLQPEIFWTNLGFDLNQLIVPVDPNTLQIKREDLDYRIPKGYSSLQSLFPSFDPKIANFVSPQQIETTDTLPLFGESLFTSDSGGFYLIEVRFGNYTTYIHSLGSNPNISAIVSRYNQTKNYVTGYSDSSIDYMHHGESISIQQISIRILDPATRQPINLYGDSSTVFLEIQKPNALYQEGELFTNKKMKLKLKANREDKPKQ